MTATKPLDLPSPLEIKKEKKKKMSENDESEDTDDDDDDEDDDDDGSIDSLLQPSILDKDSLIQNDPQDEFLQLTSLVRRVYFSYLHKSIINNYNVCSTPEHKNVSRGDLKKFASRLELHAVRASLEASLYRQTMLQIISDVKDSTKQRKLHRKLAMYFDAPPSTATVSVQTDFHINTVADINSIMSNNTKYLCDESIEKSKCDMKNANESLIDIFEEATVTYRDDKLPINRKEDSNEGYKEIKNVEKLMKICNEDNHDNTDEESIKTDLNINANVHEIFGESSEDHNPLQNDEESRDSLMQHLKDMFCESDDSSDLTTLIEKHSGVTKSNIDSEISKMCGESMSFPVKENPAVKPPAKESIRFFDSSIIGQQPGEKRKLSFSNYKNKKRAQMELAPGKEIVEDKQTKKMRGIWFVERIHQVSKLKAKMMELSMRNYRKHGRLREKFLELFGESDEQEMMPDSPIHIEEHLTACKERIAPWVVKYLMPYYTKKIIQDRLLFKAVAKHIADMLIIENTFPEEDCVSQYIKNYFRNKSSIKLESDIYI